ncbi:MAG: hypothetical protein JSU63_14990, partial [Phycisphaerales bacterium]
APPGEPCDTVLPTHPICDAGDTCDGQGNCDPNHTAEGVACGSSAQTECDNPDSCDGEGACDLNYVDTGTVCTDDGNQCTDDICDQGYCTHPYEPIGTLCDDELFCTIDEYCTSGECGNGSSACDDGIGCTDDSCDEGDEGPICYQVPNDALCNNGDWCDGVEICDAEQDCVVEAGSVPDCDDEVECTDDSCNEVGDVCVNTANDANCNNGDWCDGVEICDTLLNCVLEPGSIPDCSDGIDCTDDWCNEFSDFCVNDPNDSLCTQDGLFCNGPEICVADTGCVSEGNPCGGDPEQTCDEVNDTCLCEGPEAEAAGGRYIAVVLGPLESAAPQAIVLEPWCPEGITRYAGPPQPFDLDYNGVPDEFLAELVDDPAEAAWLSPTEWGNFGLVYLTGFYVAPGTRYTVYTDCGLPSAPSFSESTTVTTWRWGDVNNDVFVNVTDLQQLLFANQRYDFSEHPMPHVDLWGGGGGVAACPPNQMINISDIGMHLLANEGLDYPDTFCPAECAPCIAQDHCNDFNPCTDDSCNPDATCSNVLNYDEEVFCCNSGSGDLEVIDDGDACTIDSCDPVYGIVSHVPIVCQDSDDCTLDECIEGVCVYTHFTAIDCSDNSDCPETSPGCGASRCTCPGTPAALFEWIPVDATVPFTLAGNEIIIGPGVAEVTLELYVSGWGNLPSFGPLGAYQAQIDSSSYSSGSAGTLTPVATPVPCDTSADCIIGSPINVCVGHFCQWPEGAFIDPEHPDFVFAPYVEYPDLVGVVNTSTLDYLWGMVPMDPDPPFDDPGVPKYCATLILNVPADARGTFTVDFNPHRNYTFLNNQIGQLIYLLSLKPGLITITAK